MVVPCLTDPIENTDKKNRRIDQMNQHLKIAAKAIALTAALILASPVAAQPYPSRPVRMLIPYTPGGPTDFVGRAIAQRLQKPLGQQVIVDNRPGGGGVIATEIVARANPDGHTLLFATPGQLITLPLLASKLPYDTFRDFMPLTKLVDTPQVLVATAKLPVNSVAELIAYAKQRPGQLNYASVQTGGTGHLGMELLKQITGIDMVHVAYKGTAPAMTDIIGGRVQLMFSSLPSVQSHVQAGRVKLLATAARQRTDAIKDTPTVGETIKGYDLVTWYGLFVPRKTPAAIVSRLHMELVSVLTSAEIGQLFQAQGVEPVHTTPQELESLMRIETERWRKVIQTAGIRLD
jgi:tripartite-type tricarboxylate transporter receptor subunit TctC